MYDNGEWWGDVSALEFVSGISRHFRLSAMLAKERYVPGGGWGEVRRGRLREEGKGVGVSMPWCMLQCEAATGE